MNLRHVLVEVLEKKFGKHGCHMHQLSMGLDERDVVTFHDVKSIGHDDTYSKDIFDQKLAKRELLSLAKRVARRIRRKGLEGKTITLKVEYHDYDYRHYSEKQLAPIADIVLRFFDLDYRSLIKGGKQLNLF